VPCVTPKPAIIPVLFCEPATRQRPLSGGKRSATAAARSVGSCCGANQPRSSTGNGGASGDTYDSTLTRTKWRSSGAVVVGRRLLFIRHQTAESALAPGRSARQYDRIGWKTGTVWSAIDEAIRPRCAAFDTTSHAHTYDASTSTGATSASTIQRTVRRLRPAGMPEV